MRTTSALVLCALAMAGCTVVPAGVANRACELLQIAVSEADMAPAWYLEAGRVLESCGKPDAQAEGAAKACYAEARNGYRDRKECEAMP